MSIWDHSLPSLISRLRSVKGNAAGPLELRSLNRFYFATLMQLIKSVQQACPDEALVFVVDKSTVEGHEEPEAQFIEASEKSGAFVIWSTECD